jgi:hypothetical protein
VDFDRLRDHLREEGIPEELFGVEFEEGMEGEEEEDEDG